MRGTVVRIPKDRNTGMTKGFMFVKGDDGIERFVHRSGLQTSTLSFERFTEGQHVEFTPLDDAPKGPRAIELRAI